MKLLSKVKTASKILHNKIIKKNRTRGFVLKIFPKKDYKLEEIQIQTKEGCNLRCEFCPNSKIEHNWEEMSKKLFQKILKDLKEINFKGSIRPYLMNEPLIDKRLPNFIRKIRRKFPENEIEINTNGTLLDEKTINKLKKNGINKINVNAYSDKVYKKVKNFKDIYLRDLRTTPSSFYNRGGNIKIKNRKKGGYCQRPFRQMYITYDGFAVLCCSDYYRKVIMGNVKKQSITEIWNSKKYKKYRTHLGKGIRDLPLCKSCNYNPYR